MHTPAPQVERAGLRSIEALAAEWNVHRNTIHALIRRGDLTYVRVGRRIRFRQADIDRYLERGSP